MKKKSKLPQNWRSPFSETDIFVGEVFNQIGFINEICRLGIPTVTTRSGLAFTRLSKPNFFYQKPKAKLPEGWKAVSGSYGRRES